MMRTLTTTIYVAFDGKEFKDRNKCIEYENGVNDNLEMYTYDGDRTGLFDEVHFIVVTTPDELNRIRDNLIEIGGDVTGLYVPSKLEDGCIVGYYWSETFERWVEISAAVLRERMRVFRSDLR